MTRAMRFRMNVVAMQYDGTIASAGIILEWTDYQARASSGNLVLDGTTIEKDWWVVRTPDLEFHSMDPINFFALYEPTGD